MQGEMGGTWRSKGRKNYNENIVYEKIFFDKGKNRNIVFYQAAAVRHLVTVAFGQTQATSAFADSIS